MSPIPDKVATITLTDEVSAIVSGLRISDMEHFVKEYALPAKNHFFDPRYKLGRWDGKIRFFSNGGKTYVQLLPNICDELKARGYKIRVVDDRIPFSLNVEQIDADYFKDFGWELGDHQVKACNAIFKHNTGIIRVGTGGGKTLITGVLCDAYVKAGLQLIVIVPSEDLVVQTAEEISQFNFSVGVYYGKKKESEKDVIVSTWQSLNANRKMLTMFGGIIVDECHGTNTQTNLAHMMGNEGRNHPVRIGLTGTLPDYHTDKLTVLCHLGPVRAIVKSSELIKKGWLSALKLVMFEFNEDVKSDYKEYISSLPEKHEHASLTYTEFKNKVAFPNYDSEKKYLGRNTDRLEAIVLAVKELTALYGNSFILVNTIDMGTKLAKMFGNDAFFISSKIKDRASIYDLFKTNDNMIAIATLTLASTGLNIPRIFNLITIDQSKSFIRVIQTIGRGLRKAGDKDTVNVLDFYSNLKYAKKHSRKRKKFFDLEDYPYHTVKIDYNKPDCAMKIIKEVEKLRNDNDN